MLASIGGSRELQTTGRAMEFEFGLRSKYLPGNRSTQPFSRAGSITTFLVLPIEISIGFRAGPLREEEMNFKMKKNVDAERVHTVLSGSFHLQTLALWLTLNFAACRHLRSRSRSSRFRWARSGDEGRRGREIVDEDYVQEFRQRAGLIWTVTVSFLFSEE
jgi:hypothetical protein